MNVFALALPAPEVGHATQLQLQNTAILEVAINDWRSAFAILWSSTDATPQQIFDEFGVDAYNLPLALQARLDFISALAVLSSQTLDDFISPAERTTPSYTVNGDGTITV